MSPNTQFLLALVICSIIGWASSYYAEKRGRSPFLWFMVGMIFGIFGLLLLFLLPKASEEKSTPQNTQSKLAEIDLPVPEISQLPEYAKKEWFFVDKTHQQQGPVGFHILKSKWTEKTIDAFTYVWTEGMENWKMISELPQFQDSIKDEG